MAKKLLINCGTCDARNVKEETLNAYESITINCGDVIVTPETKVLLDRQGITMNCGSVLELERDVKIQSVNGKTQIRSTDSVNGKIYLEVNGVLEIGPDTQAVLDQYVGISVNGKVLCPESVSSCLGILDVNGATVIYPDDVILLKKNAVIDRTFVLRAKEKCYWSEKRIILVDSKLDPGALIAKGATFSAEEVIFAESLAEPLIDRIDEKAEIIIVPDGTAVVTDDVKLDELAVKKYGPRLYILGDVTLEKTDKEALAQVEYLNIRGDAKIPAELKELLMEKMTALTGEIIIKKGRYLSDKLSLRISKQMLEQEPEGIQVEDCMNVVLDNDVPDALILDRLSISSCLNVKCSPEQEGAVSMIAEDVLKIGSQKEEEQEESGIGGILKSVLGGAKELLDTKIINAGDYVL